MPDDPRDLAGDFAHFREVEVRFADGDPMGHANNAKYLTYCESARMDYWEAATGRSFPLPIHGETRSQILAETRIVFRSPALPRETVVVETRCVGIGRSSLRMEHRLTTTGLRDAKPRLLAVVEATQVGFDYAAGRPVALGDADVAALEAFEGRSLRG